MSVARRVSQSVWKRLSAVSVVFFWMTAVAGFGARGAWASPAATATTLAVTAGGNAASSVPAGTVVTLTATVKAGGTPVTTGLVNFCDASAAHCTDVHLLGSAQLTSAGTAAFRFRPGVGPGSVKAVFVGTNSFAASSSSVQTITGTGGSTAVSISASGTAGNYTLTSTVSGTGNVPAGNVLFLDTSNANYVLASVPLGSASVSQTFAGPVNYPTGVYPVAVASGDFNGDGILDLAVVNQNDDTVGILLGNGDGSFNAQVTYATGYLPQAIAVGDFNGDGLLDLATANEDGSVSVLLGNGNGTFQTQVPYSVGGQPYFIVVGEFNGDGIADLAVVDNADGAVVILLGKGDGTFNPPVPYSTGSDPISVAVGDFNGDGISDLAVANNQEPDVSILLGKGDGTFSPQMKYPAQDRNGGFNYPWAIAVADFNGDGIADLVTTLVDTNTDNSGLSLAVLLGNGDGTFKSQSTYATGPGPFGVLIGDFNGDGIPDVAVSNYASGPTMNVLLGNGDGTLQGQITYATDGPNWGLAAGDFNGDGALDLAVGNVDGGPNYTGDVSILLNQITASATATASGISPAGTATTHVVEASYEGVVSSTVNLGTAPVVTTLTLIAAPTGSSGYGQQVVLTATLSPYAAQGHATDGETITFLSNGSSVGTGTLSGGLAMLNVTSLAVGTDSLTTSYTTDGNFNSATSSPISYSVSPAAAPGSIWAANATGSLSLFNLAGDPSSPTAFTGGGLGSVSGSGAIAFDVAGNGWIASANGLSEFNLNGTAVGSSASTAGGVNAASGTAVDGAGNVWLANANGTVSEFGNNGTAISPSTGYAAPPATATGGIAIDLSGNVWTTHPASGTVTEILGAAAPAAPPASALQQGTTGARP